jgi:hypothetical protein
LLLNAFANVTPLAAAISFAVVASRAKAQGFAGANGVAPVVPHVIG